MTNHILAIDQGTTSTRAILFDGSMKIVREGYAALPGADADAQRRLAALPETFLREHEAAVAAGHCGLLPVAALPGMARAQIARDFAMAQALRPYLARGVILLTGNGHARSDMGVPWWLNESGKVALGIGLLEAAGGGDPPSDAGAFDAYVRTVVQARADPCKDLAQRVPAQPPR